MTEVERWLKKYGKATTTTKKTTTTTTKTTSTAQKVRSKEELNAIIK